MDQMGGRTGQDQAAGAFCKACGRPVDPAAAFCASCGSATSARASTKTAESAVTYHALVLVAGVLLAIGPFLPWLSLGMLSASGIQKTGGEAWALVFVGGVAVVTAIVSLATKRPRVHVGLIVLAVIAGALCAYYFNAIGQNLTEVNESAAAFGGEATFGSGLFMSCGGAVLLLIFAIIGALPSVGARRR
jgi:hypothetical protein